MERAKHADDRHFQFVSTCGWIPAERLGFPGADDGVLRDGSRHPEVGWTRIRRIVVTSSGEHSRVHLHRPADSPILQLSGLTGRYCGGLRGPADGHRAPGPAHVVQRGGEAATPPGRGFIRHADAAPTGGPVNSWLVRGHYLPPWRYAPPVSFIAT
jgi:hypothetical protein